MDDAAVIAKKMADRLEESGCYTVVFNGRPRDLPGNPFKIESPFGRPIAMGYGNAFDAKDEVSDVLSEITEIYERSR